MNKNDEYHAWLAKIKFCRDEYPFGPFKELRNEDGRLHSDEGFAFITPTKCVQYKDGRKHGLSVDIWGTTAYFYENIHVPPSWINYPEKLSIEDVFSHENAELKYAGMKIIGYDKMKESKYFKLIHSDKETGAELYECNSLFTDRRTDPVPVKFVRVINSTPERDGSRKIYYLCVPPEMRTCKQAIAWTFRKTPETYHPEIET